MCGLVSRDGLSAHASLPSSLLSVFWQYLRVASLIHMFTVPATYPAEDCMLQVGPSSCLPIQSMVVVGSSWDFGLQSHPSPSSSCQSCFPAPLTLRWSKPYTRMSSTYCTGRMPGMLNFSSVFAKSSVAMTGLWVHPNGRPWNPQTPAPLSGSCSSPPSGSSTTRTCWLRRACKTTEV